MRRPFRGVRGMSAGGRYLKGQGDRDGLGAEAFRPQT
jgi:hypothetical protein